MSHRFGGDWTQEKLALVEKYLSRYTTALKNKPSKSHPFRKAYIDAFAGTGYRKSRDGSSDDLSKPQLSFPDLAASEPQALLDGSARIALKTHPRFDRYIFIERDKDRCAQLESLKAEFPDLARDIRILQGDANAEIRKLCKRSWRSHRAVMFLDPYGMQLEWATIEAIAATHAIDMWLLFPLGIGVNRLLTRSGDIPVGWRKRLDALLGTKDWYEEFYQVEHRTDMFGSAEERVIKASTEVIGRYFNERLKKIFYGVAEEPRVLRNSMNCPLYLLCFAVGNKNGAPTALRIANHILKGELG
jgi:three-Cys-motif partner protein